MMIALTGKSASGKDTTYKILLKKGFKPLLSATDRPMRPKERDGVEYKFFDKSGFDELIKNNRLLEYRSYKVCPKSIPDIWRYGLIRPNLKPGEKYVAILTPENIKEVVKNYPNVRVFYIDVEDEIRAQRACSRAGFDKAEWDRRLLTDKADFEGFESKPFIKALSNYLDLSSASPEEISETIIRLSSEESPIATQPCTLKTV